MADATAAGLRLAGTWGLDFPARPGGRSFVEMGGELLAGPSGQDGRPAPGASPPRPLDYLVVAHEAYDATPAGLVAGYLADACPGDPRAFSLADQGVGAPFSGLRILDRIHRGGGLDDAALFVLDPAAGAVLTLGGTGDWALQAVAEERAGAAADCLPPLTAAPAPPPAPPSAPAPDRAPGPRTAYVLGEGLCDLAGALEATGATVRHATPGHGCAGVWRALSAALRGAAEEGAERLVAADRDRGLGRLHLATFVPLL
ncbi:hypothetical protein [Streptomyces sparsogenes]|uniref:Uncharacterized protein n=1 Tax=Streptomyces sparsogenes DSM 40356 TaxID=1331668 RepID=A0A1R1SRI0_9ACTN|nr:hypothetical protein [Streptomyces sparsogenes]OMI40885.1 hypothetical protein SPAR_03466 [Streptomyces sparsogenes DSM 40356]